MVGKSDTAYGDAETVTVGCGVGCWSTVMSWNGSRRSAYGKMTKNSSARAAASSTVLPTSLPGRPPGSRRQIQTYIDQPPVASAVGGPAVLGCTDSSSAWTTKRCDAEYFGLHEVNVSNRKTGFLSGLLWSGTGKATCTSDGSTISWNGTAG